jgi:DNA relaxase NicK
MMEVVKRYKGERRRFYSGGYMGKKRRELVVRVGYDAKNAAHLIRLLRMGIEFLTEGTLYVERADWSRVTRYQARSVAAGKSESGS